MKDVLKVAYYSQIYRVMADLYIIEKLSLTDACSRLNISTTTYYRILKHLGFPSVSLMKDARMNVKMNENKEDSDNEVIDPC